MMSGLCPCLASVCDKVDAGLVRDGCRKTCNVC